MCRSVRQSPTTIGGQPHPLEPETMVPATRGDAAARTRSAAHADPVPMHGGAVVCPICRLGSPESCGLARRSARAGPVRRRSGSSGRSLVGPVRSDVSQVIENHLHSGRICAHRPAERITRREDQREVEGDEQDQTERDEKGDSTTCSGDRNGADRQNHARGEHEDEQQRGQTVTGEVQPVAASDRTSLGSASALLSRRSRGRSASWAGTCATGSVPAGSGPPSGTRDPA